MFLSLFPLYRERLGAVILPCVGTNLAVDFPFVSRFHLGSELSRAQLQSHLSDCRLFNGLAGRIIKRVQDLKSWRCDTRFLCVHLLDGEHIFERQATVFQDRAGVERIRNLETLPSSCRTFFEVLATQVSYKSHMVRFPGRLKEHSLNTFHSFGFPFVASSLLLPQSGLIRFQLLNYLTIVSIDMIFGKQS